MDWKEITDTNIGQVDIDKFTQRVRIHPRTDNVRLIRQSGIIKAVGFPPSLIAPKLVMACQQAYQTETRTIVDRDGNILVDMSAEGITKTFHIPTFEEMETPTIEECKAAWDDNLMGCKRLINQHWLKEKRGSTAKVPQELFHNDFHKDYHDLVTMLSQVMGIPTAVFFQEWMVYFVQQILRGNEDVTMKSSFYWGGMISDYFHE